MKEEQAKKALESKYDQAEKILKDKSKLDEFLRKLEDKLKVIPKIGKDLSNVVVLISMVKSYAKKEYTEIPVGSMIAIVAALLYFLSPIDLIPDSIPGVGYLDDVGVIAFCLKNFVGSDVEDYIKWRDSQNNE